MSFKKLPEPVKELLSEVSITQLEGAGKQVLSSSKAGGNYVIVAPKHSGKSTGVFVALLNRIHQSYEGSPRGLVICSTNDEARSLHAKLELAERRLDVTTDLAHDQGNILQQRNDIFDGTEIIVGTPKRIYDLYIQNGINLNLLELFIVDDFDEVVQANHQMEIKRLMEGLGKTPVLLIANALTRKVIDFIETTPNNWQIVEVESI